MILSNFSNPLALASASISRVSSIGPVEEVAGDRLELGAFQLDPGLVAGVGDAERGLVALGEGLLAAFGLEEEVVEDLGVVHRVGFLAGLLVRNSSARWRTTASSQSAPRRAGGRRRCR